MIELRQLYKKYQTGVALSDSEIRFMLDELKPAAATIGALGPTFLHARQALDTAVRDLEGWQRARRERKSV